MEGILHEISVFLSSLFNLNIDSLIKAFICIIIIYLLVYLIAAIFNGRSVLVTQVIKSNQKIGDPVHELPVPVIAPDTSEEESIAGVLRIAKQSQVIAHEAKNLAAKAQTDAIEAKQLAMKRRSLFAGAYKKEESVSSQEVTPFSQVDQYYYLPTASVLIQATVKVIVTKSGDLITKADIAELHFDNKVNIEPDVNQLFGLNYKAFAFANDDIKLNTNQNNLLESVSSISEDRISNIITAISDAPQKILTSQKTPSSQFYLASEEQPVQNVTTQTITYANNFIIRPEEFEKKSFTRQWIINVDGTSDKATTVDASFSCNFNPIIPKQANPGKKYYGILTRALSKIKLDVHLAANRDENDYYGSSKTKFSAGSAISFEIYVPDPSLLICIPVKRAYFVKATHQPKFSNGLLVENYISKPSEIEGSVSIPVNVLKAIFAIPSQLLNFKITHIQQQASLNQALSNLNQTSTFLEQQKQNNDIQLSKTKAELELQQKQIIAALKNTNDPRQNNQVINIPEEVLTEAIDKNDAIWKKLYNVPAISVGRKKTNGIDSAINCLIFQPRMKLYNAQDNFEKIPAFIDYTDSFGRRYAIPTDVQETGGEILPAFIENDSETCDLNFPKLSGCSISRSDNNATGTIGLKVYKAGQAYILSCYHVLCSSELENGIFEFDAHTPKGSSIVISPGKDDNGTIDDVIGEVTEGKLNDFLDCALALLKDPLYMDSRICRIDQSPMGTLTITLDHVYADYKVFMTGKTTKKVQRASIKSSYTSADIDYGSGIKTLKGLIATSSLSQRGDSGAVVFDENCYIVGIVAAVSPSATYIIPITRILTEFGITIKK